MWLSRSVLQSLSFSWSTSLSLLLMFSLFLSLFHRSVRAHVRYSSSVLLLGNDAMTEKSFLHIPTITVVVMNSLCPRSSSIPLRHIHFYYRRKFRSLTSDNMQSWKSRVEMSSQQKEDQHACRFTRKKVHVRQMLGTSRIAVFFFNDSCFLMFEK